MPIEWKSDAQKACYEKIAPWVKDVFGDFASAHDDAPFFGVTIGTAHTVIAVDAWGDDDAIVNTRAYVVTKVELTAELMRYLLEQNDTMRFGAFGVDKDGDIFFEHAIVGSSCDRNELKASAMAVALTADRYDDEIVSRWGGLKASDR